MTVGNLQKELMKDIGNIFEKDLFKDSLGKYVSLNVYAQNLPIREDEDAPDPVPYIVVRVLDGKVKGWVEAQEVQVMLILGCFDDNINNDGHEILLELIQKIEERFLKNPILSKQFMFLNDEQHPFEWALQEEESFPYFFGAISMSFRTATIRKEDKYT
nr:MAG TPA: tail completion protein [Caudoviricetes sp.]